MAASCYINEGLFFSSRAEREGRFLFYIGEEGGGGGGGEAFRRLHEETTGSCTRKESVIDAQKHINTGVCT